MNLQERLKGELKDTMHNEDVLIESIMSDVYKLFEKLVVRGCFKTDRDYDIAKKTLLEITGMDYEELSNQM
jgi:hypothetical protein